MLCWKFSDIVKDDLAEERIAGPPRYRGTTGQIVDKVRNACRTFHRSPVLHDELLKNTAAELLSKKIVLDVATRWNSSLRMLERFLEMEQALRTFYANENSTQAFPLSDEELLTCKDMVKAMTHVEEATKRLSIHGATLRSADLALQVS